MNQRNSFDIDRLKGKLRKLRDWMKAHHFPPKLLFCIIGVISTIWFLVRVIPKPSRASYPCMKVAAPFMSGFIVYLLSLGGISVALRKSRQNLKRSKYLAAGFFLLAAIAVVVFTSINFSQNTYAKSQPSSGPDDGPNQPMGKAMGVNPGRVVWIWNPGATNENCISNFETQGLVLETGKHQ